MHAHTEQSYCTLMHAHTDCKILPHAKKNVSRTRSNQTPTVSCVHTHHKNLPVHPPRQHAHTHTHASTLTRVSVHTYIHAHIHNNNTHTGIKTDVGRGGHAHKVKRKVETFERDQVDEVCTCVCERDSVRERETEREKETDRERERDRERQRDRETY